MEPTLDRRVPAPSMDQGRDVLRGELDVGDLELHLESPADLGWILVGQGAAGPGADADRRRAPGGVCPVDQAERPAGRRCDVPESVGELAVWLTEQRHDRGPCLPQRFPEVRVGVEHPDHVPGLTVRDQHRGHRQPGPLAAVCRRPQTDRGRQPPTEPPYRTPLGLGREERVVAVNGHRATVTRSGRVKSSIGNRRRPCAPRIVSTAPSASKVKRYNSPYAPSLPPITRRSSPSASSGCGSSPVFGPVGSVAYSRPPSRTMSTTPHRFAKRPVNRASPASSARSFDSARSISLRSPSASCDAGPSIALVSTDTTSRRSRSTSVRVM